MKLTPDLKIAQQLLRWFRRKFEKKPRCFYCGVVLTSTHALPLPLNQSTTDHVYPRCKGGKDGKSNRVKACLGCNQLKDRKTLDAFRRELTGKRGGLFWAEIQYENRQTEKKNW